MAEHQPGMRPQHGDVVGDRLGVGGADADIDHGDAAMVRLLQVIGRHLRQARRRHAFAGRARPALVTTLPGSTKFDVSVAAIGHQLAGAGDEFVDVELVVGEQHEVLEMLRRGRGVVRQAVQRIVDALCREWRQRPWLAERHFERAVGDLVVGAVEVRHVEQVADRPLDAFGRGAIDMRAFEEGEMQRDRRGRFRNRDRNAVVAHDQAKLFDEIAFEERRLGDGGREMPGCRHVAIGLPQSRSG